MDERRYGELVFDDTFGTARRGSAEQIVFTRAERLVLSALTTSPNRVLSRNQLLDAISGPGSDASDRNVDFIVNRLRGKLKDPARTPRFIATRYGEGYVWVAEPSESAKALLTIGPVHGLARAGTLQAVARKLLDEMVEQFDRATSPGQEVRFDESYAQKEGAASSFNVEVSLYPLGGDLHCALVLHREQGGDVIGASRPVIGNLEQASDVVAGVVQEFRSLIWHQHVRSVMDTQMPSAPPVHVAMHDAGRLLMASTESWIESVDQVRAALVANPDDPQTRLMWALSLYVQVIMGTDGQILPDEQRLPIEDEIESIAMGALEDVVDNPMLKLSAAKLLLFLGRGYGELAERLAEEAFESSTAFAASFAILGQARLMRGRLAEGMDLLERGLEIVDPNTEFAVYMMVYLCGGKLAAEDHEGLAALLAHLLELSPVTQFTVAPFCVLVDQPLSPANQAILMQMGEERARRTLEYIHMSSARQYENPVHRRNVLRGFAHHLARIYGPDIVPERIREIVAFEES